MSYMASSTAKSKLEWMKDIEYADLLDKDLPLIHQLCGEDVLLSLLENFASISLYITQKPVMQAKKRYIKKHYNGSNVKQLCILLECSERFVYETLADRGEIEGQDKLF